MHRSILLSTMPRKLKPIAERFWPKVSKGDGCWMWTGATLPKGYGVIGREGSNGFWYAHRVSWEIANGPVPKGLFICHTCDVKGCVRPDHLFLGTAKDNAQDAAKKGILSRWTTLNRGERCHNAKLSTADVTRIRQLHSDGILTTRQLSLAFGVSVHSIHNVVVRHTWRHVPDTTTYQVLERGSPSPTNCGLPPHTRR